MSDDKEKFIDGLMVKAPRAGAPDFVKANISIRREALIADLQSRDGEWINLQVKESRGGKWYSEIDTWKPKESHGEQRQERVPAPAPAPAGFTDDEIPF